jgi:hypothetical protein
VCPALAVDHAEVAPVAHKCVIVEFPYADVAIRAARRVEKDTSTAGSGNYYVVIDLQDVEVPPSVMMHPPGLVVNCEQSM